MFNQKCLSLFRILILSSIICFYSTSCEKSDVRRNDLLAGTWILKSVYLSTNEILTFDTHSITFDGNNEQQSGDGVLKFRKDTIPFVYEYYKDAGISALNMYIDLNKYPPTSMNYATIGALIVYDVAIKKDQLTLISTIPLLVNGNRREIIHYRLERE